MPKGFLLNNWQKENKYVKTLNVQMKQLTKLSHRLSREQAKVYLQLSAPAGRTL